MPLVAESIQLGPWRTVRYDLPVEQCAPDELTDMQNCRIGQAGQVEPRLGTLSYQSAAALGSTPTLTMAAEFDVNATTTEVVIVAGTAIYKYSSGWSAITGSVTVTAADDNTWESVNANGVLCAVNGVDTLGWKWTGTSNAADLTVSSRFTKPRHIAWFDNRLWCGNVNGATGQVWYSDTADLATWGASSFFNFGGIVTGLTATQNALVVHTTDGIYTLAATGNATLPYRANKRTRRAAVDGRGVVALPGDTLLMIREDGIYRWTGGAELEKVSRALDEGYWPTLNTARLHKAFAIEHPAENEVWFVLPYGTSQTNPNHIMVYNRLRDSWHGPYEGWERNCAAIISNKPHLGDFGGILWDHETGDDDNGTAIDTFFETAAPAPYGEATRVRWLGARHVYDGKGAWNVTATQKGQSLDGQAQVVSMRGAGFTLGTDVLGSDVKMQAVSTLVQDTPLIGYGPNTSIRINHNNKDQTFVYRSIHLRYKPLGQFTRRKPEE